MDILKALRAEESKLSKQLETIGAAIKILSENHGSNRAVRKTGRKKRHMSAAARARIGKATRARWAKFRAAKKSA